MSAAPVIVTVTDLRRNTCRLIHEAARSGRPVFITQNGYATAVLLSREQYDHVLVGAPPPPMSSAPAAHQSSARSMPAERLIDTPYGLCDLEFAAFLSELGFDPRTSTFPSWTTEPSDDTD